jgi:hypothetical protein
VPRFSEILPNGPRVPSSFELVEVVDRILGDWAFLSASPAGRPAEGPAPLALEFSVRLRGPLDYLLVMRCDFQFGAELAHASTGDPSARGQAADAFKELCNLVAGHLLTEFFGGSRLSFEPFIPEPSLPQDWPTAPPSAESVMFVGHFPVEARLWAAASGGGTRG